MEILSGRGHALTTLRISGFVALLQLAALSSADGCFQKIMLNSLFVNCYLRIGSVVMLLH